jgi:hypothetical protein
MGMPLFFFNLKNVGASVLSACICVILQPTKPTSNKIQTTTKTKMMVAADGCRHARQRRRAGCR